MKTPRVVCFDLNGDPVWETRKPALVETLSRFGAEDSRSKVALFPREPLPSLQVGSHLEIWFDDSLKFRGEVAELRTDSASFPLVVRGARRPRRIYQGDVRGVFENATPTQILVAIFEQSLGEVPAYDGSPEATRVLDRLDFQGMPLFYAVDLLARLAGNWLWWIDWDGSLRMVPPDSLPEWVLYHDPERMVLHPWLRDLSVKNRFEFHGGVIAGEEYLRYFEEPDSRDRFGAVEERLFARPVATDLTYGFLRNAVLEHVPWPTNYRAVDRYDGDLSVSFGERFELRGNPLPPLDQDQVYRIAAEEIRWTEEGLRVRYHLAEGFESASRYARYLDNDPHGSSYVAAHLGPFTLDLSALDSEAHLDP